MIKNLSRRGKPLGQKIFVAAFYLLSGSVVAQNTQEIQAIRKETATTNLGKLQKSIERTTLSQAKLQKKAKELNVPFRENFEGKLIQLKGFDARTGLPNYYATFNSDAGKSMAVDKVHSTGGLYNLDGEGIIVHEWDGGGVRLTHQELKGRVIQKDNPSALNDHAVHVAGTMIASGVNSSAKGMLPKATLHAYEWTNDLQESIDAAQDGAIVSNHSYGNLAAFEYGNFSGRAGWHWFGKDEDLEYVNYGRYDLEDASWDMIARNAPYYLPVKAAGNSRGGGPVGNTAHYVRKIEDGMVSWVLSNANRQRNGGEFGYDTLVNGTTAKNILIVGAARKIPNGYQSTSDVVPAPFSVFGPTDDGRIKPDIMGIGVNIFSTLSTEDNAYDAMSGTSMAAPGVTASLGLFQQHYKNLYGAGRSVPFMKAATLRALAIHTANEAGTSPGPDYQNGWGVLNALKGVQTISVKDKYSLIEEKTLNNGSTETISVVASGTEPLVVTIAWQDPAAIVSENYTLNDRTSRLVNDLDLRVSDGTDTFLPWKLDPRNPGNPAVKADNLVDNVEQVVIENPVKGKTYTITISHKGTLKQNEIVNREIKLIDVNQQDFSVIVTGINNGIGKDLRVNEVKVPKASEFTTQTPVNVKIENIGNQTATGAKLKYELLNTDENNKVVISQEIPLEDIAAGATLDKTFNIDLSASFINYAVTAEVVWTDDELKENNKASVNAFGLIADLTKENTRHDYSFETGFAQNGWSTQDADNNQDTWDIFPLADYARTGTSSALNFPRYLENGTDDWLFSNPLRLKANTKYRVVINTRNDDPEDNKTEHLNVAFGKKPENTAMSAIGEPIEVLSKAGYIHKAFIFTPTEDGIYHIGFHHKRDKSESPYGIMLDDISIQYADSVPMPEFYASKTNPNTVEPVILSAEVEVDENDPATEYEWSFEPSTVTFLEGTTAKDSDIAVSFNEEVYYNVTLKAKNSKGEGVFTKKSFVKPANVPVHTSFFADQIYVYQGDPVTLTNSTIGNPEPDQWKWTITPSEGVEFINGTSDESYEPMVKFGLAGKYTVKLKATSPINSSDEQERKDMIEVRPVYTEVRNLKHTFDENTKNLELKWDLPYRLPIYGESFETTEINEVPNDFAQIDEDEDFRRWRNTLENTYKGKRVMASLANNRAKDTRNWLITGKVPKGAEELRFWRGSYLPQTLEAYFVPASAVSGTHPNVEEISAKGVKLYDETSTGQSFRERLKYSEVVLDLSSHSANEDFFIAFLHKKKKEDVPIASTIAHLLYFDELEIGYKDKVSTQNKGNEAKIAQSTTVLPGKESDYGRNTKVEKSNAKTQSIDETLTTMGVLPYPRLVGYEVEKNATNVKTTRDTEDKVYTETISTDGVFVYDVYAVYSNGQRSLKQSVTLDTKNLSISEVKDSGLKIYPNPSDGRFVIEAKSNISSLKAEVYDMSGKLIFKNEFKGNKADLNLTQYPKGVYILNLVDNNGEKHSAKLMIK